MGFFDDLASGVKSATNGGLFKSVGDFANKIVAQPPPSPIKDTNFTVHDIPTPDSNIAPPSNPFSNTSLPPGLKDIVGTTDLIKENGESPEQKISGPSPWDYLFGGISKVGGLAEKSLVDAAKPYAAGAFVTGHELNERVQQKVFTQPEGTLANNPITRGLGGAVQSIGSGLQDIGSPDNPHFVSGLSKIVFGGAGLALPEMQAFNIASEAPGIKPVAKFALAKVDQFNNAVFDTVGIPPGEFRDFLSTAAQVGEFALAYKGLKLGGEAATTKKVTYSPEEVKAAFAESTSGNSNPNVPDLLRDKVKSLLQQANDGVEQKQMLRDSYKNGISLTQSRDFVSWFNNFFKNVKPEEAAPEFSQLLTDGKKVLSGQISPLDFTKQARDVFLQDDSLSNLNKFPQLKGGKTGTPGVDVPAPLPADTLHPSVAPLEEQIKNPTLTPPIDNTPITHPGVQALTEPFEDWLQQKPVTEFEGNKDSLPNFSGKEEVKPISTPLLGVDQGKLGLATNSKGQTYIYSPTTPTAPNNFQYVKNEPLQIKIGQNDKQTSQSLRNEFVGVKNSEIVAGNTLRNTMQKLAPKPIEQEGSWWVNQARSVDSNNPEQVVASWLDAARKGEIGKATPEYIKTIIPQLEAALNLSPGANTSLEKARQYFFEQGQDALQTGATRSALDEYGNRIYKPEPHQDFVKTDLSNKAKTTTGHALQRTYANPWDAVLAGKQFATTNLADTVAVHNEEFAKVKTAIKLFDTMQDSALGKWTTIDDIPPGYKQVGNTKKGQQIFVAPEGIVKGLKAITDFAPEESNFWKTVDRYQGLDKSTELALSLFHHFNFLKQTVSSADGLKLLAKMPQMYSEMQTPEWQQKEKDFVRHTGMTSQVAATMDIMKNLDLGTDFIAKLHRVPGLKQFFQAVDKNNEFLFGGMQRYLKVGDWSAASQKYLERNPDATPEQIKAANTGFARAVNNHFGGRNWEALGSTAGSLKGWRRIFLAPDWLRSNMAELGNSVKLNTPEGRKSGSYIIKGLVGGIVMTEGLNLLINGHTTDKNSPNCWFGVEVAPGVCLNMFGGALGEVGKGYNDVMRAGNPQQGVMSYLQGKLAPVARSALTLASGVNYAGRSIYDKKGPFKGPYADTLNETTSGGLNVLSGLSPVPFGAGNLYNYLTTEKNKTIPGGILVGTGIGPYKQSSKKAGGIDFSGLSGGSSSAGGINFSGLSKNKVPDFSGLSGTSSHTNVSTDQAMQRFNDQMIKPDQWKGELPKENVISKLYNSIADKTPFLESTDGIALKKAAFSNYKFTPEMQQQLQDRTKVSYSPDVKNEGGGTEVKSTIHPAELLGRLLLNQNRGRQDVNIHENVIPAVAHELFHAAFDQKNIDPIAFNKAWKKVLTNEDTDTSYLDSVDQAITGPLYKNISPQQLANERFAYYGEQNGVKGTSAMEPSLAKFYSGILQ